ncbi:hypothetical protein [Arthrobacter sp. NEB 688]|uniref:hypothetical protein n=1 Tax=Arthrobacter sp. NEB 688 TaxID=904039 RepID=UPI0015653060|nr:hypothetical protein [Arthrobacter sp. NEB 688]QKE82872.1 hypothetical protein HL663_02175 [Arthrobacter sp. NEB 688]
MADGAFMSWAVVLDNAGPDLSLVDVTVTGLSKSGEAVATTSETLSRVPTGESYVAGLFDEKGVKRIEVDISGDDSPYAEDYSPISGELGSRVSVSGRSFDAIVRATVTSSLDVKTSDGMPFYIAYFDADGNVVGGSSGFTPGSFRPGKTRQVALQSSMIGPPADRFKSARISFDLSDSYLEAS